MKGQKDCRSLFFCLFTPFYHILLADAILCRTEQISTCLSYILYALVLLLRAQILVIRQNPVKNP